MQWPSQYLYTFLTYVKSSVESLDLDDSICIVCCVSDFRISRKVALAPVSNLTRYYHDVLVINLLSRAFL